MLLRHFNIAAAPRPIALPVLSSQVQHLLWGRARRKCPIAFRSNYSNSNNGVDPRSIRHRQVLPFQIALFEVS